MNKTNLIVTLIVLSSFQSLAQKDIIVLTNKKQFGKDLVTGEIIEGHEYTFPNRIQDFQIDTVNNYLTILLRGLSKNGKWLNNKGHFIRYDIEERKVLWSEKIAFQVESIEQFGSVTLRTTGGKSYCLDSETGEELWEVKNSLILVDPIEDIGIGYKIQPAKGKQNTLQGIDLNTGRPIWEREINREYSWNDFFYLNDSTLLVGASGLHTVNIVDGTGWDYNTTTGKKDYTASAVGTGLGIAAGLLTGMYSVTTGHNLVRDVVSNIIVDSLSLYFASKEHLVRLDKKGEIIWRKTLPSDMTSRSWIFKSGQNLVMVNRGYAYMGYRQLDFGTPFIASFDLYTGDQNYFVTVSDEKKEIIKGLEQNEEELLFVYNDHVAKYAISDGKQIIDRSFNIQDFGELNYFVGNQVFVQRDSLFFSLPQIDSSKHYLYTKNETVLVLNSDLKIEDKLEAEECYIYYLNKDNKKFIAKDNQTYVIDSKGKKVAEIAVSRRSTLLKNHLYDIQERSFLEISLKNELNQ